MGPMSIHPSNLPKVRGPVGSAFHDEWGDETTRRRLEVVDARNPRPARFPTLSRR